MLQHLARRQPGSFLAVYVEVLTNPGPEGGLLCLFQRADGRMQHVPERELIHYTRLHAMLQNERFAQHPLVTAFNPACRTEAAREWSAFAQAHDALRHVRATNPYAGLSPQDVCTRLFTRLRSGTIPAPHSKPGGPV